MMSIEEREEGWIPELGIASKSYPSVPSRVGWINP